MEFEHERGHENKMFRDEREKQRAPTLQQDVDWRPTAQEPIRDDELDF